MDTKTRATRCWRRVRRSSHSTSPTRTITLWRPGFQLISRDTGGFFARTHLFVEQAMKRLAGAIAGYYVLFLEQPDVAPGTHAIRVRLTRGQGTVFAKHAYVKPTSVR